VGYVGDVAVYVNADAKAASYEVRSKILEGAREALLRLLRSPEDYERIVLVGHSLGSVIAYDLINRLLDEVRAAYTNAPGGTSRAKLSSLELRKLRGLATFGSPLDKVYYFFRAQVPAQQPIRAQILSFMHGFRRAPSNRRYGAFEFQKYVIPEPAPDFTWINLWALADPVSGHLDFYRVAGGSTLRSTANQFELPYPMTQWGRAHVRYWSDPEVYARIVQHLL
jgi:pimeloyl-ACP methyl ester carboxylesterase